MCKAAYVHAAAEKARSKNGKVNRARVATITGLTRAEVTRLLNPSIGMVPRHEWHRHRAARVLDGWFLDRHYKARSGRPKDLQRKGSCPSFHSLVKKYSGDIPAKAMLEELLNVGAVELRENGMLRARRRSLVSTNVSKRGIVELGEKAGHLLTTLVHNLENPDDRLFEAAVSKTNVDAQFVPYLRREVEARCNAVLNLLADQLEHPPVHTQRKARPQEKITFGIGVHLYLAKSRSTQNRKRHFT